MIAVKEIKYLAASYYFIFSIGLLILFYCIGTTLGNFFISKVSLSLHQSNFPFDFNKPVELISYILPAISLFLYYGWAYFHLNYRMPFKSQTTLFGAEFSYKIVLYFTVIFLVNSYPFLWIIHLTAPHWAIFIAIWLFLFLLPFFWGCFSITSLGSSNAKSNSVEKNEHFKKFKNTKFYKILAQLYVLLREIEKKLSNKLSWTIGIFILCSLLIQLWLIFIPYFKGETHVYNDYMGIPEQTKLGKKYIDNLTYINRHRLMGFLEPDPRLFNQPKLKAIEDYIPLPKSKNLIHYYSTSRDKYSYDDSYHGLFVNGLFTKGDKNELCLALSDPAQCEVINKFYQFHLIQSERKYSLSETRFLEKNWYELGAQLSIGHYFLHQGVVLNAINEYNLGKPATETVFLYGWLNTVMLTNILHYIHGINFSNYIRVTYPFYPIYYSLVGLIGLIVFKNIWQVIFLSLVCIGGLLLPGFESIDFAPGFNPIRHFFDIFVFLFFYFYLFAKQRNAAYLGLTLFFAILAYLGNKEFGLFIIAGLSFALLVKRLEYSISRADFFLIILGVMSLIACSLAFRTEYGVGGYYFFLGLLCPETHATTILSTLTTLSLIYVFLMLINWPDNRWKILSLFLFGYAQSLLIYYIWNPSPNHFYPLIMPWAMLSIIFFRELFNASVFRELKQLVAVLIGLVFIIVSYVPTLKTYYVQQGDNIKVFKEHKKYYWNMPTAQFYSTMDPLPFENSIKLIKKYSSDRGIYIISRFDSVLPFLAEKYSLMPFSPLYLFLVTDKEIQMASSTILVHKPQYIFIDSHIKENHRGEVSRISDSINVYSMSRDRYLALSNMSKVFELISAHYEPLEFGQLITVYRFKG